MAIVIRRRRPARRLLLVAAAVTTLVAVAAVPAAAAVEPPPRAARPTPGSGVGTKAALENPRCTTGERYGVYGRFDSTTVGGGPICVRPWSPGDDNGGATARGVTRDSITVVAMLPNDQQWNPAAGTGPQRRSDNSRGTYEDAVHDYFVAAANFYETWGRDIVVRYFVSTGSDEAAQRADAVAVKAERPFAVLDFVPTGLDVFDSEMAKAKVLVFGYATTTKKALAQAPYRWGQTDAQAAAVNSAEVIGKQLTGKKAAFAGNDEIRGQTRKFGTVYIDGLIDIARFRDDLTKFGQERLTSENSYSAVGDILGETSTAQEQAPVLVTKMKQAGVTTVVLFTDIAMTRALMEQATRQDWYPEWFLTGTLFHDLALLARSYPTEQSAQAFGISNLSPWVIPDPAPPPPQKSLNVLTNVMNWYWGEGVGTFTNALPQHVGWLLTGIHTAGPELRAKTFQQGMFSIPASGGAAQGYPTGSMSGYGKNARLPYDEYMAIGADFAPIWWDPETVGPSAGTGFEGTGIAWYADGAKRYTHGTVPKKQFSWFDEERSIYKFDTRPTPTPQYAGDCAGCPSQGGPGQPGVPAPLGFVVKAGGGGSAAL